MSRQELVSAFLEGQISRRTLIRRLIAGGVSTGAAISYAQMLSPERAGAAIRAPADDLYPLVDMTISSTSLATVRNNRRLAVSLTSSEELEYGNFRAFMRNAGGGVPIGSRFFPSGLLAAAGTRDVVIPITGFSSTRTSVRFYVQLQAQDAEGYWTLASAAKTLT